MSAPRLGYDLETLRSCLSGVGGDALVAPPRYRALHVLGRCASTNDDARALVLDGAEDGTVVVADEQTAGRGRLARVWHSPAGLGVYASVVFRDADMLPRLTLLPLLVGVALTDALVAVGASGAAIEWPNDVLLGGRKVAGILCEYVPPGQPPNGAMGAAILGVGVNVGHLLGDFPAPLRDSATSLRLTLGHHVPRESVLCHFLAALNVRLSSFRGPADFPWDAWRERSVLEGRDVRVASPNGDDDANWAGRALRVDPDGALVVSPYADGAETGEERRVLAGDVTLSKPRRGR